MGKKLLIALGVLVSLHVVALVGLAIVGLVGGKFDHEKMKQYIATWNGEILVPYVEEVKVEEVVESPQDAKARIAKAQFDNEMMTRDLEKNTQNLQNLQFAVEQARIQLAKEQEKFIAERDAFENKIAEHNDKVKSEGFQKALKYYSNIKSKLVKEDFMVMPEDEVVRYLGEMKADIATEILNNFKAPNEQAKRVLLQKMLNDYKTIEVANNKTGDN
ncbi:MAG: hypothetical protein JEZ07_07575 [Phycisphaerae bacterium]|nr:hypothetical protein [Phycisphaerae bacterium]